MSFMLALPKISLHGAGAIADMANLVANKQWGKALIVTDGQLVKLGLLDSLFAALDKHQMSYHLFDEVFPNPTEELVQKGFAAYQDAKCDYIIAFGGGSPIDTAEKSAEVLVKIYSMGGMKQTITREELIALGKRFGVTPLASAIELY